MCAMKWQESNQRGQEVEAGEAGELEQALEQLLDAIAEREEGSDDGLALHGLAHGFGPALDLVVDSDGYRIVAELPGVDPATLKVTAAPRAVVIEGEWGSNLPAEQGTTLITELRRGPFRRIVDLPGPASGELAQAELDNGLLVLTLPLGEESQTVSINVELA